MDDKKMPKEVADIISNILQFLEKSEKDYVAGQKADKEAEYENC